jgi:uncharacterized ion transporter superfamily protein YfcC
MRRVASSTKVIPIKLNGAWCVDFILVSLGCLKKVEKFLSAVSDASKKIHRFGLIRITSCAQRRRRWRDASDVLVLLNVVVVFVVVVLFVAHPAWWFERRMMMMVVVMPSQQWSDSSNNCKDTKSTRND